MTARKSSRPITSSDAVGIEQTGGRRPRPSAPTPSSEGGAPSRDPVPPVRRGLLTPQEAAALLSVPASRMKRMRLDGVGPAYIAFGRVIRYHPQDITHWIKSNRYETR